MHVVNDTPTLQEEISQQKDFRIAQSAFGLKGILSITGMSRGLVTDSLYPIGFALGSRSDVPAVVGDVTNGPPSSGAVPVKATSGISLGLPARGNSFRSG